MDPGIRRSMQELAQNKKAKAAKASQDGDGRTARFFAQAADHLVHKLTEEED